MENIGIIFAGVQTFKAVVLAGAGEYGLYHACNVVLATAGELTVVGLVSHRGARKHDVVAVRCPRHGCAKRSTLRTRVVLEKS